MKKIIAMSCLVFATAFTSIAQDNSPALIRANKLSDQMIRDLKLNNFQANRLRDINKEKVSKMMEIETKFASDAALVDKNCKGVCKERDRELQAFLSSDQYSSYYGSRNQYYKTDKEFAAKIGLIQMAKVNKPASILGDKDSPVAKKPATVLTSNGDDTK